MKNRIVTSIRSRFPDREEGQGMVEYGLIIALVAVVAIAGLVIMGPKIAALFTALGTSV